MVNGVYPFTGHYLDLGGLQYHYLDEGEGEPVVMLHGNPTWSIYYRHLVKALRGEFRTIVPDHIGCGLSDKPGDDRYEYTLKRRVDDLEALLEHLGIEENINLVLHDWGGMIGMAYATRYPGRIKRFVVMNTSAFHLPKTKMFPWPLWLCRNTWPGAFLVLRFNAFSRIAAWVCCRRTRMSREVRDAYCSPYDSWSNRIATLRFVQDIPLRPGDASYALVSEVENNVGQFRDRPIFVGWGMKDFVFDRHFLECWLQHFPEAEVHRFEDCGHYVLEDASEELVPRIAHFLGTT